MGRCSFALCDPSACCVPTTCLVGNAAPPAAPSGHPDRCCRALLSGARPPWAGNWAAAGPEPQPLSLVPAQTGRHLPVKGLCPGHRVQGWPGRPWMGVCVTPDQGGGLEQQVGPRDSPRIFGSQRCGCPPRTWCNDNLGLIRTLTALGSGSLGDKGGESICPGLILATFPPEAPAQLPQVPPPPGLPYPQAQVPLLDPLRRASRSRGGRGTGRAEGPGIPALPWLGSRSQPGPALQAPEPWKVLQAISSCSGAHPPCTVDEGRAAPLLSQVCGRACPMSSVVTAGREQVALLGGDPEPPM